MSGKITSPETGVGTVRRGEIGLEDTVGVGGCSASESRRDSSCVRVEFGDKTTVGES